MNCFQSHANFKEWFSNPLTGMVEDSQEYNESLVKRLHKVHTNIELHSASSFHFEF